MRASPDLLSRVVIAAVVATVAFWAYSRTLLPGVDLGDTGGFQAAAIWPETTTRESYPLYFALGESFMRAVSEANPARGLNLFSSLCGALAAGLLAFVVSTVARSAVGGAVAGLLLAFSYTFWSQAIIAEVYTLHLLLIAACLTALIAYQQQPSRMRLAAFFSTYAISFGNHFSMILLLVPFAVFLAQVHPRPRELFRWPIVALAVAIALSGTLVYAGNFLATWNSINAEPRGLDRLAAFWFDVTKADWRESMVLGIADRRIAERLAMWWWDTRQQFGIPGILLAVAGGVLLWRRSRAWAVLVFSSYAICAAFALTYNVGDVHVFFLPAHFFTAFAAGAAVAAAGGPPKGGPYISGPYIGGPYRRPAVAVVTIAAIAYAGWRGWDTWPAVDRHSDRRPDQLVTRVTQGLNARDTLLISGLDWQSENALLYATRHSHRGVAWTRLPDVLPHLPFLVEDNAALGRTVILTAEAAADVVSAYGPLFPILPDEAARTVSLPEIAAQLPPGTPYVLTLLPPTGTEVVNAAELGETLRALAAEPVSAGASSYQVWAGVTGSVPLLTRASMRPFRATVSIAGDPFTIRMESWLPDDTFRRAGFGRVLRGREPVLTIERGISLLWFRTDGTPAQAYASGLYAVRPRFRIPARTAIFALSSELCGSHLPC